MFALYSPSRFQEEVSSCLQPLCGFRHLLCGPFLPQRDPENHAR
jgi:hypothetical protein